MEFCIFGGGESEGDIDGNALMMFWACRGWGAALQAEAVLCIQPSMHHLTLLLKLKQAVLHFLRSVKSFAAAGTFCAHAGRTILKRLVLLGSICLNV